MSERQKGWHSRGYLPHFDAPEAVQSITFRLADSLPASVAAALAADVGRRRQLDQLLDRSLGRCCLWREDCATLVENALLHFDGDRYKLLAWCVMPNHVHVLIEGNARHSLGNVVQTWKSFTGKAINMTLKRVGRLWAPDYFDRYVRDDAHFAAIVSYIEGNPVKARLVDHAQDWRWSSAFTAKT